MNLRLAILALSDKYGLSEDDGERLRQLAGLDAPPSTLADRLPFGTAILGAALGGLGVLFWIAANWASLPQWGRFALLEAALVCMLLGAWYRPGARVALSLLGFLICGGLFACFGQTYQTGADPWQLFALWAALTLPLCLGVRHDVLWTAWTIVALTAALLLSQVQVDNWWDRQNSLLLSSLGSWIPALALAFAYRFIPTRITGTGLWPMRLCLIYATIGLGGTAFLSLFVNDSHGVYPLTLLTIAALAYAFSLPGMFDVFVVSALGLGANVIVVSGLAKLLLGQGNSDLITAMVFIGGTAAAMLAATVKLIAHLAHRSAEELPS
ncbi:hypothetical protein RugamoR64_07380 [Duganella rhizosphaerae]|uniref:DUF2157 domain-containing protein n=1 Tax=Duganella rhizosphaerae TaxID=2885763 RepID=UPI0030E7DD84